MAQIVEAVGPNIDVLKSISVDVKKYNEGTFEVPAYGVAKGALCGCEACENLVAMVNAISEKEELPMKFVGEELADATPVAMSIQVNKPGFLEIPNLKKKSGGKFTHVFFSEEGKFSLVKIYKHMRDHGESFNQGPLTKYLSNKIGENAAVFDKYFSSILPYPFTDVTSLGKDKEWKKVEKRMAKALSGEKPKKKVAKNAVPFDGVFLLFGRYVPMVSFSRKSMFSVNEDGSLTKTSVIPGLPTKKASGARAMLIDCLARMTEGVTSGFSSGNLCYMSFAYDTVENKLIWSPQIDSEIHVQLLKADLESYGIPKFAIKLINGLPATGDFIIGLNEYFKKSGSAEQFSASFASPTEMTPSYSERNWTGKDKGVGKHKKRLCYYVDINFEGKPLIGVSGKRGGNVLIRQTEKGSLDAFTLVQSSWCQRISSWSKNVSGAVDQKYDIWDVADWLSGPFAEQFKMDIKPAPLVFLGNKSRTGKADVLAKMRKRLSDKMK
jgi:hypothetical protein